MKKRIFITGGAGFIGSALVNRLVRNYDICVYDNLSFGSLSFIEHKDFEFVDGDIRDAQLLQRKLAEFRPDYVLHLAALHFIPYCNSHPILCADVNIKGTYNMLEACQKTPSVRKVLFASTAAVYPIVDEKIHEGVEASPSDIYGITKLAGEEFCKKFHYETNIPTVICRFFNAFGPNETNPHLIPAIEQQVKSGATTLSLGNLEPRRDFIHTYDMAEAVELLLEEFKQGIDTFNIGRGIEYSVTEVVDAFGKALEKELYIEVDQQKVRKTDRLHLLADIDKLSSFTGWKPKITLEEGIKTLLQ